MFLNKLRISLIFNGLIAEALILVYIFLYNSEYDLSVRVIEHYYYWKYEITFFFFILLFAFKYVLYIMYM